MLRIVVSAVFNQKPNARQRFALLGSAAGKPHHEADFSAGSGLWITLWVERLARSISAVLEMTDSCNFANCIAQHTDSIQNLP
jgi:hypothetical protein